MLLLFSNIFHLLFSPQVTDYRTAVSGVRPEDLVGAPEFKDVQAEVAEMIKDRVLVGHAIHHDLKVLFLDHPKKLIRDTSKYKPFKAAFGGRTPGNDRENKDLMYIQTSTDKSEYLVSNSLNQRTKLGSLYSTSTN